MGHLATQGEDTTAAAFHILPQPKFQVFIPQHSLTLGQDYCLIYMLLPINQDFWLKPAVERLHRENDVAAQKSLLLLLWYAQTSDSDKAIADFSTDAGKGSAGGENRIPQAQRANFYAEVNGSSGTHFVQKDNTKSLLPRAKSGS